jgi:ribosome maturation factor RimP
VLIEGAFHLEVSSPGIDRPLTRDKDFANWAGHEVRIVMDKAFDGQRVNKGVLHGLDDGMVRLTEVKAGDVHLPIAQIHTAKLVLTDALIAATRPLDTSGADEVIEVHETRDSEEKADD